MKRMLKRLSALLLALALLCSAAPTVYAARITEEGREIRYGTIRVLGPGQSYPELYQAARDDENNLVYIHAEDFAAIIGGSLKKSGKDDDWYFSYTMGGWNLRVCTKRGVGQLSYDFDPNEGDDVGYSLYDDFQMTDCLYDAATESWYFPFEEMLYMMALQWGCEDGTVITYRPETLFDVISDYGNMVELTPTYADLMGEEGMERWGYASMYGFGAAIDEMDMSFIWYGMASGWSDLFGKQLFSDYEKETMQSALLKLQSDLPEGEDSVSGDMDWVSNFIGCAATVLDLSDEGIGFDVAHELISDMLHVSVSSELMGTLSNYATIGAPLLGYAIGVGQTMWVRDHVSADLDERLAYIERVTGERADDSDFWEMVQEQTQEVRSTYCGDISAAYGGLSADDLMTMSDGILTVSLGDNWKDDLTGAAAKALQDMAPEVAGEIIGTAGKGVAAGLTILNWMNLTVGTLDLCVEVAKDQNPDFAEALALCEDAHLCRYLIELSEMLVEESRGSIQTLLACGGIDQELLDEIRMSTHMMMASSLHAHDLMNNLGTYAPPSGGFAETGYIVRLLESAKHDDLLLMNRHFSDIISEEPGCIRQDIPVEYVRVIEPIIVTTETTYEEGPHFSATITRPIVYSAANPELGKAIDETLNSIYSEKFEMLEERKEAAASCTSDMQTHTETAKLTSAYSNGGFLSLSIGYGYFSCNIGHNVYQVNTYVFDVASGAVIGLPDLWDMNRNPEAENQFLEILDEAMTATGLRLDLAHEPSKVTAGEIYRKAVDGVRYCVDWDLTPHGILFQIDKLNMGIQIGELLIPYSDLEGILREEYLPAEIGGTAELRLEPYRGELPEGTTIYDNTPAEQVLYVAGPATNLWVGNGLGRFPEQINGSCAYFYAFGIQNCAITLPTPLYSDYGYAVMWQDSEGDHMEEFIP